MRGALFAAVLTLTSWPAAAQNDASDAAIDARIRASADAAENLQGPLDGSWTLVSAAGQAIFAFQIVDKPGGRDPLEGVWRDLRHPAMPGDIGLIDGLTRGGDTVTISFTPKPGQPAVSVALKSGPNGQWAGQLNEAGVVTQVSLRRG